MKKRKVICSSELPLKSPFIGTLVWWLVLDKIGAPEWVWHVISTLLVVMWIISLVDFFNSDDVKVIKREESEGPQ